MIITVLDCTVLSSLAPSSRVTRRAKAHLVVESQYWGGVRWEKGRQILE